MEDQSDKDLIYEEMSSKPPTPERVSSHGSTVKICVDCGTSKTPLWRGGPAGPKSLCNACGIKSRKKRRTLLGISKEEKITKKLTSGKNTNNQSSNSNSSTSSSGECTSKLEDSLKNNRFWSFGRDVAFQRPRSKKTQRRKIGEEEQAAILLMALSCGSVYA